MKATVQQLGNTSESFSMYPPWTHSQRLDKFYRAQVTSNFYSYWSKGNIRHSKIVINYFLQFETTQAIIIELLDHCIPTLTCLTWLLYTKISQTHTSFTYKVRIEVNDLWNKNSSIGVSWQLLECLRFVLYINGWLMMLSLFFKKAWHNVCSYTLELQFLKYYSYIRLNVISPVEWLHNAIQLSAQTKQT